MKLLVFGQVSFPFEVDEKKVRTRYLGEEEHGLELVEGEGGSEDGGGEGNELVERGERVVRLLVLRLVGVVVVVVGGGGGVTGHGHWLLIN